MSKRKKHHEEHLDESWLIPYADILTLLLALFIVLFAVSQVDQKKFKIMAASFQSVFQGGSGLLDQQAIQSPPSPQPASPLPSAPPIPTPQPREQSAEMQDLAKLKEKIDKYIKDNKLELSLQTVLTDNGLMITILDKALFDSGSAEVRADSITLSHEISNLLISDPPREIQISGHTDNVPISTQVFRSNWDLSAMRALNFLKIVLENKKLSPDHFSATGYGEFRPAKPNNTEAGREKNRRVEVLILPNFNLKK